MRSAALLSLMIAFGLPVRAAEPPNYREPGKDWGKGPVRWLMSEEEEKELKKLRTDPERAAFVKAFWEKRDPTPGTPVNEYEVIFWERVDQANKSFKTQTGPLGSLSDMGRVFLLLGPPAQTDKDGKQRSIWTYEPNEITGIDRPLRLIFAPTTHAPLLLDRKVLEEYVASHPQTRGIGWKIPQAVLAEATGAPAAPAQHVEEDLSPESKRQIAVLEEILGKGNGPSAVPFQVAYDFYAAADGTTLTAITVEAPRDAAHGSGDAALRPFARLQPATPGASPVNLTGDLPFVPAPPADCPPASFIYQARRNLAPGTYKVAVVVEDKVVPGQSGAVVQSVEIPDYRSRELGMSSVSLLAKFTRIERDAGPGSESRGAGPYVLGSFRLVPRGQPAMQAGEALAYYYQVYNPAPDPATGRPSLEATYAFFLKEAGVWKPFRKPIVKSQGQVELYAIDLKDLLIPNQKLPAEFRLELKVVDTITGKELRREMAFTVRP